MPDSAHSPIYQKTLSEIEAFIACSPPTTSDFNSTALSLFQYQYQNNQPYRNYVDALGSAEIVRWQDIPAITTNAFKCDTLPSCINEETASNIFTTSGTTGETRGRHLFRSTTLYEKSILAAWEQLQLPPVQKLLILSPSPDEAPHSSLSYMMEVLRKKYAKSAPYLIQKNNISTDKLFEAVEGNEPLTILGTALGFLNLFEQLEKPLKLPAGSWAMETGGYKGSGRTLTKEALYAQFDSNLGLRENAIWNEYSMTELSSQFYTNGIGKPHRAPHWCKIQVVNPETDQPVHEGEMGYLVIYDLANIDSVCAIRTQDIAIYHNEHQFTLIGRDPSALPRGCSRSIDELINN